MGKSPILTGTRVLLRPPRPDDVKGRVALGRDPEIARMFGAILPGPLPVTEEEAADFIKSSVSKPVSSYIAGVTAPAGKKMGHAGAIVSGNAGTAQGKMDALRAAGVKVGLNPTEAGELMVEIIQGL